MQSNDIVDVLIIGSGASGAAVAWSLAETRMKILCLEQGDWMKQSDFPSHGRDWEARRYADFDISPNRRARPTDYPINDDNSPMKIANFNGVGGGTVMYTAHFPRMHPSDFRVRTLDGVADDWPIDYATLEPFFAENDRMMGVVRAGRRSGLSAAAAADAAAATRQDRRPLRPRDEQTGLALVAVGHARSPPPSMTGGRRASISVIARRAARRARRRARTSPIGRMRSGPGVELRTRCRVREITTNEHGMACRRDLLRRRWDRAVSAGGGGHPGLQRHRHAATAAQFGVVAIPQRAGQFQRSGRQEPDAASVAAGPRLCRRASGRRSRADAEPVEQGVLRNRPVARFRARLHAAVRPRRRRGQRGDRQRGRRTSAVGRGASSRLSPAGASPPADRHRLRGPAGGT